MTGPIETKARADVEALMTAHPMGEVLAEMAFSLARDLDAGVEAKSKAGISRELRSTLVELAKLGVEEGDDDAVLSTPVRDSEDA